MKTNKHRDDGLDWLRKLRGKIAAECDHDLKKQSAVYRQAAASHSYKVYKGESAVLTHKKRVKLAA